MAAEKVEPKNSDDNSDENNQEQQIDILNMSDEDLVNFDIDSISDEEVNLDGDSSEENENENESEEEESEEEEEEESESEEESSESESEEEEENSEEEESEEKEESETDENEEESDEDKEVTKNKTIVDELFTPFKANGKDMQVDSVADARKLMQMGANYNKKMAGLKPNLKIVKMLENNDLLDESKLNFLIDINNKNPEAITRLIKDSGINPLEINVEKDTEYEPNSYNATDSEVDLDLVLKDIKDSDTYQDTMTVVSTKWDDSSKRIVVENPEVIRTINDHMSSGIYEKINKVMESEKMLGKLAGKSDIEAYREIGDRLFKAGAFNETPKKEESNEKPAKKKKIIEKAKNKDDLSQRKKAASVTKQKSSKAKTEEDFNPLSLSDEDFEKETMNKYL